MSRAPRTDGMIRTDRQLGLLPALINTRRGWLSCAESSCRSPRHQLAQMIGEVSAEQVIDEITGRGKPRASRGKGVRRRTRVRRRQRRIAEVRINGAEHRGEHRHSRIRICGMRWKASGIESGAPFHRAQWCAAAESAPEVPGHGQMADQPSGGLGTRLRLQSEMGVVKGREDRFRVRQEVMALPNAAIHRENCRST